MPWDFVWYKALSAKSVVLGKVHFENLYKRLCSKDLRNGS